MKVISKAVLFLFAFLVAVGSMAAEDECDLDEAMRQQRIQMDQRVVDVYRIPEEAMDNAPHVKDGACLPILDQLDGLIRLRIPTMGGMLEGLWAKIKDQVCKMANNYIQGIVNKATYSVSDPLGVVGISAGATNGTGGASVETYDFGKVIEGAATGAVNNAGGAIQQEIGGAINQLPSSTPNRTPRIENEIDNGVNDAIRGL